MTLIVFPLVCERTPPSTELHLYESGLAERDMLVSDGLYVSAPSLRPTRPPACLLRHPRPTSVIISSCCQLGRRFVDSG